MTTDLTNKRILRRGEVASLTGLSPATLYRLISRGAFPRPVQLGQRATGWSADEVEVWLDSRQYVSSEKTAAAAGDTVLAEGWLRSRRARGLSQAESKNS